MGHEHRRADMFDVDACLSNAPSLVWDENDNCLATFLAAARDHGLVVTPMALERGHRQWVDRNVVEMSTDLSVIEVSLAQMVKDSCKNSVTVTWLAMNSPP